MQCDGQLDWRVIPVGDLAKGETAVNLTMPTDEVYQVAMSANDEAGISSGMVWTTCTILHDKVVGRMKPVVVGVVEPRR